MQKLIRNHQWLTRPNPLGISLYGWTSFSKNFLLKLDSLNTDPYFKTSYGLKFPTRIKNFLHHLQHSYKLNKIT